MISSMFEIKSEKGFALLNTLIFIVFLGLLMVTLARLVVADAQMQAYYMNEKRAFYAAESGLEYALKGLELTAQYYNDLAGLHNVTETIPTGGGTQCQITYRTYGLDSMHITATGQSGGYVKTVEKGINYVDVSQYAVYASGNVSNIRTSPSGLIKSNAAVMPYFELDVLRDLAKPTRYFPGDLLINNLFTIAPNSYTYVENNLTFGFFSWANVGNFVAGNSIQINSSFLTLNEGVFYLPNPGSSFTSSIALFPSHRGGLIVNGDATCPSFFLFRYKVYHHRPYLINLLSLSVNEGPVVYWNASWSQR